MTRLSSAFQQSRLRGGAGGAGTPRHHVQPIIHLRRHGAAEKRISYKPSVITLRSSTRRKYFISPLKIWLSIIPTRCSEGTAIGFKDKYRQYDLPHYGRCPIPFKKERPKKNSFHLFNTLHDTNKQIVFSSDRAPSPFQTLPNVSKADSRAVWRWISVSRIRNRAWQSCGKKAASARRHARDEVIEYVATTMSGSYTAKLRVW